MRKILFIISMLLVSFLFAACADTSAAGMPYADSSLRITRRSGDFQYFNTTEELVRATPHIVRVEVLDERVELIDILIPWTPEQIAEMFAPGYEPEQIPQYTIHTIHRARVVEVFKGDTQVGDIIDIKQWGGQVGNEKLVFDGQVHLELGESLVAFLWRWQEFYRNDAFSLINPTQATYRFPGIDGRIMAFNYNDELEAFSGGRRSHYSHLPLTIGDLLQVAEANFGAGTIQSFSVELDSSDTGEYEE